MWPRKTVKISSIQFSLSHRLAFQPLGLTIELDRQLEKRLSDVRRILLRGMAKSLRMFSRRLRLGHCDALPKLRPVNNISPLRVGFDTFLFFAGLALGLRTS
jgi:hypothetical protein